MKRFKIKIILVLLIIFIVDLDVSKQVAVRYLEILTIKDSKSYEQVKKRIRGISPKNVKNNLLEEGKDFNDLEGSFIDVNFVVKEVKLFKINNFRDYDIKILFYVIDWGSVESITRVKKWKIVEVYRLE